MAIIYPRELIDYNLQTGSIEWSDGTVATSSNKGQSINISSVMEPVAQIRVETGLLYPDQVRDWSAWKNSLRGGTQFFIAADVRRRKPKAYPNLTALTANVTALTRSTISLSGLNPLNYIASAGDRIGLEQNGRYGYYEVLETVVASNGGVTLTVYPFVHTAYFNTLATCRLVDAKAKFKIDWQSWTAPDTKEPASVTFTGTQRI